VQRIIETAENDESVLFEALNINDELQKALSRYEELKKPHGIHQEPEPPMIPVAAEPEDSPRATKEESLIRKPAGSITRSGGDEDIMDDLDEMIFGKKSGNSSAGTNEGEGKKKASDDDLISF
jgi:GAT domain